jgi:hypothetical protein
MCDVAPNEMHNAVCVRIHDAHPSWPGLPTTIGTDLNSDSHALP